MKYRHLAALVLLIGWWSAAASAAARGRSRRALGWLIGGLVVALGVYLLLRRDDRRAGRP